MRLPSTTPIWYRPTAVWTRKHLAGFVDLAMSAPLLWAMRRSPGRRRSAPAGSSPGVEGLGDPTVLPFGSNSRGIDVHPAESHLDIPTPHHSRGSARTAASGRPRPKGVTPAPYRRPDISEIRH